MTNLDTIIKATQWTESLNKSFGLNSQLSEMLKTQERITNSFNGLTMINEITKSLRIAQPTFSAMEIISKSMSWQKEIIPQSTLDSIASISKQHEQLFGNIKAITEALKFQSPITAQINNLHFALNGISGQLATIAAQQRDWSLIDDFENITEQTLDFTDSITEEISDEQKRQFQVLLTLVATFLNKHKALGVYSLLIIDIFLRFAGVHQYYDFVKEKPELATKKEVSQLNISQDSIRFYIQEISEQLKEVKEYRITNRVCEVKLKPKSKTTTLVKLPENFEVVKIQVQHKWVLVSYFDPNDNLPQTGWIMKKYLDKPK
ncbi:MAG: hypothetical protein JSS64_06205 [Bacteroidetes bacterium]|nr:hypothetical protein [Bacteroidota bacterium]